MFQEVLLIVSEGRVFGALPRGRAPLKGRDEFLSVIRRRPDADENRLTTPNASPTSPPSCHFALAKSTIALPSSTCCRFDRRVVPPLTLVLVELLTWHTFGGWPPVPPRRNAEENKPPMKP